MDFNTYETQLLTIVIPPELRDMLNNGQVEQESKDSKEINTKSKITYDNYRSFMETKGWGNSITSKFLDLIFQQYPIFERIKDKIRITTRRTCNVIMSEPDGAHDWHVDGNATPYGDRNFIINWGLGTKCCLLADSLLLTNIKDAIRVKKLYKEFESLFEFQSYILNNPEIPIELFISESNFSEIFKEVVMDEKNKLEQENHVFVVPRVVINKAPNKNGNAEAAIFSSHVAYHTRDILTIPSFWRYVFNIYFFKNDIERAYRENLDMSK